MTWLDGVWCGTFRISNYDDDKQWENLPKGMGVYRLLALINSHCFSPESLSRVCGEDETGTLYIGRAGPVAGQPNPLANRLGGLAHTHHRRYGATTHSKLPKPLGDRFPDDKLAIIWELTDDPAWREAQLLQNYEDVFGELPPLNGQRSKASKMLPLVVDAS
jgi:hypothetical protein